MIQNELRSEANDQTYWSYREWDRDSGKEEASDVVETKDGDLDRLLAVDGRPLNSEQARKEDARVASLVNHPEKVERAQQKRNEDDEKERELLRSFPNAFLYQYDGKDGDLIRLRFRPNPDFHPSQWQEQVFHHMAGTMWIDPREMRLAAISGRLTSDVKFLGGILGHLDEGGTFSVKSKDVGAGHWDLVSLDVNMNGRVLLFKTIHLQEMERCMDYRRVSSAMSLQQAAELLEKEGAAAGAFTASSAVR